MQTSNMWAYVEKIVHFLPLLILQRVSYQVQPVAQQQGTPLLRATLFRGWEVVY